MAKSPKSHLLEELRAKAESVSAKRVEQQELSREVVERVDKRLHAVFQYFDEACTRANVRTLRVDGSRWLADGTTSLAELLRVTGAAS